MLALACLVALHWVALTFSGQPPEKVHKIASTVLQIGGGFLVLHSLNSNVGLFRQQSLGRFLISSITDWLKAFPFRQKRTITGNAVMGEFHVDGFAATGEVGRRRTTVEERLTHLEHRVDQVQAESRQLLDGLSKRVNEMNAELGHRITRSQTDIQQLASNMERTAVGGITEQLFGIALVLYGSVAGLLA